MIIDFLELTNSLAPPPPPPPLVETREARRREDANFGTSRPPESAGPVRVRRPKATATTRTGRANTIIVGRFCSRRGAAFARLRVLVRLLRPRNFEKTNSTGRRWRRAAPLLQRVLATIIEMN